MWIREDDGMIELRLTIEEATLIVEALEAASVLLYSEAVCASFKAYAEQIDAMIREQEQNDQ